jgi:hypothetical protein
MVEQTITAPGIELKIRPDLGVLVLNFSGDLKSTPFERIAKEVEQWLEANGRLNGLVLHAPQFPGWKNLKEIKPHLEFLRAHEAQIGRIALAVGGLFPEMLSILASYFVHTEFKTFATSEVTEAIAWAARQRPADFETAPRHPERPYIPQVPGV